MFRLKISSILNRIQEVKVHLDVSSRNNGFAQSRVVKKASSSKLSSKSVNKRIEVPSFQPSTDETKCNSKDVKSCYKLEMNNRGTSLSFTWALKSRNKVKHTLGIKQARPKLPSRSVKNDPRRPRGGPKLKFISDPSEVSGDTPKAEPVGQVNEEDKRQKRHASKEAFDSERKSRLESSKFRGLYCTENKEASLPKASSDSKDEVERDLSNITPVKRRKQDTAKVTKEKFATNNDSRKRRSGCGQPLKETTRTQARSLPVKVFVCNNERKETPLLPEPVRDFQETQSQSKTKMEHQSTVRPEVACFLPAAMETMKAEDGIKLKSTWESIAQVARGQHPTSVSDLKRRRTNIDDTSDCAFLISTNNAREPLFSSLGEKTGIEDGRVEATGASNVSLLTGMTFDRLMAVEDAIQFFKNETEVSPHLPEEVYLAHKPLVAEEPLESTKPYQLSLFDSTADDLIRRSPPTEMYQCNDPGSKNTLLCKGLPSPDNGPNEMSKKGFGVTREDLLKAVEEQGPRMRAVDLAARFRHQLETQEAQVAFLHLLKEDFKPEEMNGELFVRYNVHKTLS